MKLRKIGILLGIIGVSYAVMSWDRLENHKFYLSVSQLSYSEKDLAIQMTCRVFTDDLNAVLKARYGIAAALGTGQESPMDETYAKEYILKKIQFFEDDNPLDIQVLGYKKDNDVLIYFLEAKTSTFLEAQKFEITNTLLTDLFDSQQNVVHLKFQALKKSFLLMKDKPSGIIYRNK